MMLLRQRTWRVQDDCTFTERLLGGKENPERAWAFALWLEGKPR